MGVNIIKSGLMVLMIFILFIIVVMASGCLETENNLKSSKSIFDAAREYNDNVSEFYKYNLSNVIALKYDIKGNLIPDNNYYNNDERFNNVRVIPIEQLRTEGGSCSNFAYYVKELAEKDGFKARLVNVGFTEKMDHTFAIVFDEDERIYCIIDPLYPPVCHRLSNME